MNPSTIVNLTYLYIFVAIVASICTAQLLEKRLKARLPTTLPYRWGFYVGCMGLACAPIALFCALAMAVSAMNNKWDVFGECLGYSVFFAVHTISGWFIIQRRWWAWVLGTIASLNIFVWIINAIYGRNRRTEFVHQPTAPIQPPPLPLTSLPLHPSSFTFSCPHCGQHISTTTDTIGTQGGCPTCENAFTVPSPNA